jgi:CRP-like cAMP-binding protein
MWQAMVTAGTVRRFETGERLVRQGDQATHVLVLTAGQVKVTRFEPHGEEVLLAIRGPGEVIGEISTLDGGVRSANVLALTPCITYLLSASRFLAMVREHRVEPLVFRHVLARYRESEDVRAELAELSAEQRIVRIVIRLAEAVGGARPALVLSQEELATAAGLSRSATAAVLARLRRRGLVATGRCLLTVDLDGLRSMTQSR